MKRTLHKTFLAFTFTAFLGAVNAQTTPANATWSLMSDPSASTSGSISAGQQQLGPLLTGVQYNTSYGTSANNNITTGWQRVGTTSGIRTGSDTAFTQGSYVEYSVSPTNSQHLRIDDITAEVLGGGTSNARLAVMYSLDNFATMDSLPSTGTYNGNATRATRLDSVVLINGGSNVPVLTGQQTLTFTNLGINVAPNQTFRLRFYVWLTSYSSTIRHLGERNVAITGVTSPTALPLNLISFNATNNANGVELIWKTTNELNVHHYIVEYSTDGRQFATVGTLNARNSANNSYTFTHPTRLTTTGYYRVKIVDRDGSYKYSGIMRVNPVSKAAEITIAPNPVKGGLVNLQLSNIERGNYTITIYNGFGQQVISKAVEVNSGVASFQIQLPATAKAGIYNLQLRNGTDVVNKKVVVE